jgi:hypothetical protein
VSIRLIGSTSIAFNRTLPLSTEPMMHSVRTIYELSVGDYVELRAYQNRRGSLNIKATGNYSPEFIMVRMA